MPSAELKSIITGLVSRGWSVSPGPDWARHLERGIDIELVRHRESGTVVMLFGINQAQHVSFAVVDLAPGGKFVEFGVDSASPERMQRLVERVETEELTMQTFRAFLASLLAEPDYRLVWEVQQNQDAPITVANLDSNVYVRPVP